MHGCSEQLASSPLSARGEKRGGTSRAVHCASCPLHLAGAAASMAEQSGPYMLCSDCQLHLEQDIGHVNDQYNAKSNWHSSWTNKGRRTPPGMLGCSGSATHSLLRDVPLEELDRQFCALPADEALPLPAPALCRSLFPPLPFSPSLPQLGTIHAAIAACSIALLSAADAQLHTVEPICLTLPAGK